MTTWPKRRGREAGKLTWRCRNRLSLSSAWFAPLNRGSLNSAHIHGTDVPVEEPSTASNSDVGGRNREVRFHPDSYQTADIAGSPFRAKTGSDQPHLIT